jgi:hypothetical protein
MPTVIGYHDVKDKDHWLASPKREEVFGPLGVTNIRTFVDPENPTRVAVLMDVADMDALMSAMQTEAMAEAMAYDGVLPETLVILVEAQFTKRRATCVLTGPHSSATSYGSRRVTSGVEIGEHRPEDICPAPRCW